MLKESNFVAKRKKFRLMSSVAWVVSALLKVNSHEATVKKGIVNAKGVNSIL